MACNQKHETATPWQIGTGTLRFLQPSRFFLPSRLGSEVIPTRRVCGLQVTYPPFQTPSPSPSRKRVVLFSPLRKTARPTSSRVRFLGHINPERNILAEVVSISERVSVHACMLYTRTYLWVGWTRPCMPLYMYPPFFVSLFRQ